VSHHHILVTGGAGFIGSHAVTHLLGQGHRVTVLDDFSSGSRDNLAHLADLPGLNVVEGDVRRPLADQLRGGDATHVLHLAAQVSVARSMNEPGFDLSVNVGGTLRVVEYARAVGARKVVFASSAAIYGDGPQPASEDLVPMPLSPYGIHKLTGEHHLRVAARSLGLPTLSLRFFNVYGPRQDPKSHYAGVISIFLARALANGEVSIFGTGEATRDFVYVGDLVEALGRALFGGPDDGRALNVGTGRSVSIAELAKTVIAVTRAQSEIRSLPERPGDILHSRASVQRIAEELGWHARTPLADGLSDTARWMASLA
jgi:nucleoside-diphosphate-sugar epimerase